MAEVELCGECRVSGIAPHLMVSEFRNLTERVEQIVNTHFQIILDSILILITALAFFFVRKMKVCFLAR